MKEIEITLAKITHRDYVPEGYFAKIFCQVEFFGYRAEEMSEKWDQIEDQRYKTFEALYQKNKVEIGKMRETADKLCNEAKASRRFFRFWYNKCEKRKLFSAKMLRVQAAKMERENEKNRNKEKIDYDICECYIIIKKFLEQEGFSFTRKCFSEEVYVTETEYWTKKD